MVTVRFNADDLKALADPALITRAELEMIDRGVDVLVPITRAHAPTRTGRGRAAITGKVYTQAKPYGRVYAGKAFYLRILATGTYKKPEGYWIDPKRIKSKAKARQAARALGPARTSGALTALRFKIGGAYAFRGRVHRTPLRPDDFFTRAALAGEAAVGSAADAVVQQNLDRATRG
jgi:hypothetical protein